MVLLMLILQQMKRLVHFFSREALKFGTIKKLACFFLAFNRNIKDAYRNK